MAKPPGGGLGTSWTQGLSFRRLWDLVFRIARLDESVASLQHENSELRKEIIEIQKQLADHEAQLRLLTGFVRDSLTNRLEAKIEKLAGEIASRKKT